jgi:GrpB-like predicted nucleotidyltransferase (UPF0157 family)
MKRHIRVVEHNASWKIQFEELRAVFVQQLNGSFERIEHVGSTSVPGLAAKPILDVVVVIESRTRLTAVIERLGILGYEHEGDLGVRGREAFGPGDGSCPRVDPPTTWPRHHLYVCDRRNAELERQLLFRDWLRAHPIDAERYGSLKRELAEQHPHDIRAYTDGKANFVEQTLRLASADNNWRPPVGS